MLTCFAVGWVASLVFPSRKDTTGLTLGTIRKQGRF
jgi:hypothetical protein